MLVLRIDAPTDTPVKKTCEAVGREGTSGFARTGPGRRPHAGRDVGSAAELEMTIFTSRGKGASCQLAVFDCRSR